MYAELRTFLAVVRYGSFARAGDNIGLTQGAVSAQIQRLEQHIGVSLFDRSGRRAMLTPEGREIHTRAEDIVVAITQLGKVELPDETRGTLVLGAITSAQQSWLIDALAIFRKEFPGMSVRIIPGDSLNIIGQVDAGEIDLAVMIRPPYVLPPEISWHTLMKEPFVVLVPADYEEMSWQQALQDYPFVRYVRTSFGGRTIDQFLRKRRIVVRDAIELDEIGGLIRAVEKGIGVAMVPVTAAHTPFSNKVRVLSLDEDTFYRELGMAERGMQKHPVIASRIVEILSMTAAESALQRTDNLVD